MIRLVITVLVAAGLGYFISQARSTMVGVEERFVVYREGTLGKEVDEQVRESREEGKQPKLVFVNGVSHPFGSMQHGEKRSHEFEIRNEGDGPLRLDLIDSTCKCTVGEMEKSLLPPGETTKIKLTWTAQTIMEEFGQSATIKTNDPTHPEFKLTVEGKVVDSYVIKPAALSLGSISVAEPTEREFFVYSYLEDAKELKGFVWSDVDMQPFVEFDAEPVPVESTTYVEQQDAKMAHKVTIKFQPGMPLGPFSGKVTFMTDKGADIGELSVPARGRVEGEISLIPTKSFDTKYNILDFGTIKSSEGAKLQVLMSIRGDGREDVKASVKSVEPEFLKVSLAEGTSSASRRMQRITVEVPRGSEPVVYSGSAGDKYGKVVIETNHPSVKQIPIYIRLVVSE